jgi:hypothetical protein
MEKHLRGKTPTGIMVSYLTGKPGRTMESQITATDKPEKPAPENKKTGSKGVSDPP